MNDRLAPHSSAVLGVGLDAELIDCVGLQVVNDRVASRAGLVVPLPVPLTITHRVVSILKTVIHDVAFIGSFQEGPPGQEN